MFSQSFLKDLDWHENFYNYILLAQKLRETCSLLMLIEQYSIYRMLAQVCKADKAEVTQNNDISLTQKQGLRNSQLKWTPAVEDGP